MAAGRPDLADRIRLLRSFDPAAPAGAQVPDPYGGGPGDFAEVFDLIAAAAKPIPLAQAQAREELWTPEKEGAALAGAKDSGQAPARLWTPSDR